MFMQKNKVIRPFCRLEATFNISVINDLVSPDYIWKKNVIVYLVAVSDINKKNLKAEACIRVLSERPLCKVFQEICDKNIIYDASAQYLHDLVHTMYPAGTQEEFNVCITFYMEFSLNLLMLLYKLCLNVSIFISPSRIRVLIST